MILTHIEQLYAEVRQAKHREKDFPQLTRTPLKVGVMCTIAPVPAIRLIGQSRRAFWVAASGLRSTTCQARGWAIIFIAMPLFREQMMVAVGGGRHVASGIAVRVKDLSRERYIHHMNCEFVGWVEPVFAARSVRRGAVY